MRFFIALEIPDTCRDSLKAVQTDLQQIVPEVRLTNNEKLHLTIAFIGEQPEKMINDFTNIIKEAVVGISPFPIIPSYIDAFPNLHNPDTFWVGVKGDIDKLFVLRERIKDGIAKLGLDTDERRYIPHIAIGKVSNYTLSEEQEAKLQEMAVKEDFESINISSIKLFESIPEEGFHTHNTLAEVALHRS
ncbi:MAG: RNA 2',3'-cyclic phosphodiesterase [Candidatus Daviesbacteria bacterium]|nr:RNA 2',3'-cyclic phosphodiesterase [Candidatus Daviesbacteria bacterium]